MIKVILIKHLHDYINKIRAKNSLMEQNDKDVIGAYQELFLEMKFLFKYIVDFYHSSGSECVADEFDF